MPPFKSSTWNQGSQKHGVAVCLLDNWVEERSVSEIEQQLNQQQPNPTAAPKKTNRVIYQHGVLDNVKKNFVSTNQDNFQAPQPGTRQEQAVPPRHYVPRDLQLPKPAAPKGTRRSLREQAMWEQAARETQLVEEEITEKDWRSSYREYFDKEFESWDDLLFADEELMKALNVPVTIWQQFRDQQNLYVSSLRHSQVAKVGQKPTDGAMRAPVDGFGKNAEFTTPTELYLNAPQKNL